MNAKSMLVGFLIAVVASTGTYFLMPPPTDAEAASCATKDDVEREIGNCMFKRGGKVDGYLSYFPLC